MRLTVKDVAKLLAVSEKTIYRWVADKKIPSYRVNEQYRFVRAEILEWAMANRVSLSPEIFAEPDDEVPFLPSLRDAVEDGGIFYRVEGSDRDGVLRAIVRNLRLPGTVDQDFVFEVLRAREMLGSTGIGDGIAVPHPRNPVILHVEKPSVMLSFLEKPIEFGALDGKPVFALFAILSPAVKAHLHLLSRLAFALQDTAFRSAISDQAGRENILSELARVEEALAHNSAVAKSEPRE